MTPVKMAGATGLWEEANELHEDPMPGPCSMEPQTGDALALLASVEDRLGLREAGSLRPMFVRKSSGHFLLREP